MIDTGRYKGSHHFGGYILTRLDDGATLFFQPGGDTGAFLDDFTDQSCDTEIDLICDDYSDLFEEQAS